MTYEQFIAIKNHNESIQKQAGDSLKTYPKGSMGLTPDSAKDQNWYQLRQAIATAKNNIDSLFKAEKAHYKTMLKQSVIDRDAKRAAKLLELAAV